MYYGKENIPNNLLKCGESINSPLAELLHISFCFVFFLKDSKCFAKCKYAAWTSEVFCIWLYYKWLKIWLTYRHRKLKGKLGFESKYYPHRGNSLIGTCDIWNIFCINWEFTKHFNCILNSLPVFVLTI